MTQNCDVVKAKNRGVIFRGVARFCWQNGWLLLKAKLWRDFAQCDAIFGWGCRTLDTHQLWRDFLRHGAILTDLKHYLSTPWPICWVSLVNLIETKWGNF